VKIHHSFHWLIKLFALACLLAACMSTPTTTPALIAVVTVTPTATTVAATATPPTETIAPTPSLDVPLAATPLATATAICFAGWSPDSRWMAYWASQEDVDSAPAHWPVGTLHFANVETGETCAVPELVRQGCGTIGWSDDGAAIVHTVAGWFSGRPCQPEPYVALTDYAPDEVQPDPALSPDGRYRATTVLQSSKDGIETFETSITAADETQPLQRVTWQIDQRIGDYALDGEWVSRNQFLIYESLTQGPLLIDVEQGAIPAATDLFGLQELPSILGEEGYGLRTVAAPGVEPDAFHLVRSKPAVPFAGKYRIIDFTLSNCVNSGIFTIGICTQYRPRSPNDHIRTGRPWDLDRSTGGVTLLQPYVSHSYSSSDWYQGTADAIYQNLDFIRRHRPKNVVILAGDHVYRMDYSGLVGFHLDCDADLTIATLRIPPDDAPRFGILKADGDYRVVGFEEKPEFSRGTLASMGVYVFDAQVLEEVLTADAHTPGSGHDFGGDVISQMIEAYRVYAFPHLGYWVDVGAIETYWQAHMDLLEDKPPLSLFDREWLIHTRSDERPPANFRNGAMVRDSLIADGCVIEGVVEHSVLSPGVVLRPGAIVRRSIVMTNTVIEENSVVDHAILDKHVRVGVDAQVGWGDERADNIAAGLRAGLTVVGKNTRIPAGMRIGRNCVIAADLGEDAFEKHRVPSGTSICQSNDHKRLEDAWSFIKPTRSFDRAKVMQEPSFCLT